MKHSRSYYRGAVTTISLVAVHCFWIYNWITTGNWTGLWLPMGKKIINIYVWF